MNYKSFLLLISIISPMLAGNFGSDRHPFLADYTESNRHPLIVEGDETWEVRIQVKGPFEMANDLGKTSVLAPSSNRTTWLSVVSKEDGEAKESNAPSDNKKRASQSYPQVYFTRPIMSEGPTIKEVLLQLIKEEKTEILTAQFRFTLFDLAEALVGRRRNKVSVKVAVDKDYETDFCQGLHYMVKQGVLVYRDTLKVWDHMHHKFWIFKKNRGDKPLVVTGSFNCTGQAEEGNFENIVILDDVEAIEKFKAQFACAIEGPEQLTATSFDQEKIKKVMELKGFLARQKNSIPEGYQFTA